MEGLEIQRPEVTYAAFSVNPTVINTPIQIIVQIVEKTIILPPEKWYSGEIYSTEV